MILNVLQKHKIMSEQLHINRNLFTAFRSAPLLSLIVFHRFLQFHAEVDHSENGRELLHNFVQLICHAKRDWCVILTALSSSIAFDLHRKGFEHEIR